MTEFIQLVIGAAFILSVGIMVARKFETVTVFEYEKGIRFNKGKLQEMVGPGKYTFLKSSSRIDVFDLRRTVLQINNQELLSADNVTVKISMAVSYQISDPKTLISQFEHFQEYLYMTAQLRLREVISTLELDEILGNRNSISTAVTDRLTSDQSLTGLVIYSVDVKDIMLTGDLKKVYAESLKVKKEAMVSLEKARGEMASLRSLANAAKMLEKNPELLKLRMIQTIESSTGNTFMVDTNIHKKEGNKEK